MLKFAKNKFSCRWKQSKGKLLIQHDPEPDPIPLEITDPPKKGRLIKDFFIFFQTEIKINPR